MATIGTPDAATLNIVDNDTAPGVNLSVSGSPLAEDGGNATVTATLSNPSSQDVTIQFAFSGTATGGGVDYTASASSILVPAGDLSGSISLTSLNDELYEGDETLVVDIDRVSNGSEGTINQVTAIITDAENSGCVADSLFQNITYTADYYCSATARIRAGNGTYVSSGIRVIYSAPQVELLSGFSVVTGGELRMGDGIPQP